MNHSFINTLAVYLSGSIAKGHEVSGEFWGEEEKTSLSKGMHPHEFVYLDPSDRTDDLSDALSLLGRDILMVLISDAIIVDARNKRGIGVGAEIDRAETQNIPIIAIVPPETTYHKKNATILGQSIDEWKHPFIFSYADHVAQDFEKAGAWIASNLSSKNYLLTAPISSRMLNAMQHYIKTQLHQDLPMKKIYETDQTIHARVNEIASMEIL